jgi:glycosyltransferase involved in cell wall biosynthesis
MTLNARFKLLLTHFATNIACSSAVANYLPSDSIIIPNSFDSGLFKCRPEVPRVKDVLFVGRLVSDKGCIILIEAIWNLVKSGLYPSVTIAGEGSEMPRLKDRVLELGMQDQVQFVGSKRGRELAELMNAHKILAVPSVWPEPFGIVALEGAGSGCVVVGSMEGGLGEAIGPCGIKVPNRESSALAAAIQQVLFSEGLDLCHSHARAAHLTRHLPQNITLAYECVLKTKITN